MTKLMNGEALPESEIRRLLNAYLALEDVITRFTPMPEKACDDVVNAADIIAKSVVAAKAQRSSDVADKFRLVAALLDDPAGSSALEDDAVADAISSLSAVTGKQNDRLLDLIADRVIQNLNYSPVLNSSVNIARKAIDADTLATAEKRAKEALHGAYVSFKDQRGIVDVERDSIHWIEMIGATKPEYLTLQRAKRDARDAKRRLGTAIRNHRNLAQAEAGE